MGLSPCHINEKEEEPVELLKYAHDLGINIVDCRMPDPKSRDIIDIAMVNKFYDLASAQGTVPESVMEHYRAMPHTASECIVCKGCESRCPFEVKIADRMKKTAALILWKIFFNFYPLQ